MINPNCLKTSSLEVCFCFFVQFGRIGSLPYTNIVRPRSDTVLLWVLSWSVEPLCMVELPVITHLLELKLWSGRWERFLYYFFVLCQYEKSHDFRKLKFSFSRLMS